MAHLQWDYKDKTQPWMHPFIRKKLWFHQVMDYQSLDNKQQARHNLRPTQEDCSLSQQARRRRIHKDYSAVAVLPQVHQASSELQDKHRVRIRRLHRLNQAYLEHRKQQVGYLTRKPYQDPIPCNLRMQIQLADSSVRQKHLLQDRVEYLVKTHSKIDRLP